MASTQPPFTLRSAAGLPTRPPSLRDSTLVVIDAQAEYSADGLLPLPDVVGALEQIAALLDAARSAGSSVVHVTHVGKAGGLFDPERGGRVLPPAAPISGERVISKTLPNAFAGTELLDHVEHLQRRPLVLVGFMTHMCVSSTARAALDLGLDTCVVSDATATRSLPGVDGRQNVSARSVHDAALAALADRFSIVTSAANVIG